MSVNRVILVGNVGSDPSMRYIDGKPVANVSLATNEPAVTRSDGTVIPERVEWHTLVMWGRNAELAEQYINKGAKLYVEGRLRTRTWQDQAAIKHRVTEVWVDSVDVILRGNK